MKRFLVLFVLMFAVVALGACKKKDEAADNPCAQVVKKVCGELGEEHPMCKDIKEEVGEAGPGDQDECKEMLGELDEMIKAMKAGGE
jgi:hypothetical protein